MNKPLIKYMFGLFILSMIVLAIVGYDPYRIIIGALLVSAIGAATLLGIAQWLAKEITDISKGDRGPDALNTKLLSALLPSLEKAVEDLTQEREKDNVLRR